MNSLYLEILIIVVTLYAGIVAYIEIKKYIKSEDEMRSPNDMNVFHVAILSNLGLISIGITAVGILSLIFLCIETYF